MFAYGLVFRMENRVFLALYDGDGNIQDAGDITDPEDIYLNLPLNTLSVVAVEKETEEKFTLRDLKTVTVQNDKYHDDEALSMLIKEGKFPALAKEIYNDLFGEGNDES